MSRKKIQELPGIDFRKIQVQGSKYSDLLFKNNPISKFEVFPKFMIHDASPFPLYIYICCFRPFVCWDV